MAERGWVEGIATGCTSPPVFRLRPKASRYIISHELTHLVQGNGSGISHGEVACDIWIISRLPVELLDQRLYYLLARRHSRLEKEQGCSQGALCLHAIELRKPQRTYIVWLRSQLKRLI
jgi:hypothetical protein